MLSGRRGLRCGNKRRVRTQVRKQATCVCAASASASGGAASISVPPRFFAPFRWCVTRRRPRRLYRPFRLYLRLYLRLLLSCRWLAYSAGGEHFARTQQLLTTKTTTVSRNVAEMRTQGGGVFLLSHKVLASLVSTHSRLPCALTHANPSLPAYYSLLEAVSTSPGWSEDT